VPKQRTGYCGLDEKRTSSCPAQWLWSGLHILHSCLKRIAGPMDGHE
jgi:hypothetical protein